MKYSLDWLKAHIDGTLPGAKDIRRIVTMRAFEVEEVEEKNGDAVFDIKVLPDRAHDALSHRGMAREIAALLGLKRRTEPLSPIETDPSVAAVPVTIEDPSACARYIGVRIEGIAVRPSPKAWRERLERIGERSISNVVDLTNLVLFDIGQPMHVFDADKVKGGITVRRAKKGETIMTLDGRELRFDGAELVIADAESILALAGVKGGKKAEVDGKTKNIIIESANFDPTLTRRTSTKHGLKTSASKRYENGITSAFAGEGLDLFLSMLREELPDAKVGKRTDVYPSPEDWTYRVGVSLSELNGLLGSAMTEKDVEGVLSRLGYRYEHISPKEVLEKHVPMVLGKAYKNPSSMRRDAPEAFSCSSLASYLYALAGVWMPSISVDKYVYGAPVEKDDLRYGDLIFSNTKEGKIHKETVEFMPGTLVPEGVDHVGVYLGDGDVLHASRSTGKVAVEAMEKSPMFEHIVGFRRIAENLNDRRYVVSVPPERLDLRIPADLIEEIGRHYGYEKIPAVLPRLPGKGKMDGRLAAGNKIRAFLAEKEFSEVFTYSFAKEINGEIKVVNPVGEDRPFLRDNLSFGLSQALALNAHHAPLLGMSEVRIFELGNVFVGDKESHRLSIGYLPRDKKTLKNAENLIKNLVKEMEQQLGFTLTEGHSSSAFDANTGNIQGYAADFILEADKKGMIEPAILPQIPKEVRYVSLSAFPFIVRDIALFVPQSVPEDVPAEKIKASAGDLVVRMSLFDRFQKPGEDRVSYAYRLVFQSFEKTLTDDEANARMKEVYELCAKEGWQVR